MTNILRNIRKYVSTFIITGVCVLLGSCLAFRDNYESDFTSTMDPLLAPDNGKGAWWDTNTIYYFEDPGPDNGPLLYSQKHLRFGQGSKVIETDSVWGHMYVDSVRNNITFNVEGYVDRETGDTIIESLNSTTWHYEVQDTVLTYESNTTFGRLTYYKK